MDKIKDNTQQMILIKSPIKVKPIGADNDQYVVKENVKLGCKVYQDESEPDYYLCDSFFLDGETPVQAEFKIENNYDIKKVNAQVLRELLVTGEELTPEYIIRYSWLPKVLDSLKDQKGLDVLLIDKENG